MRFRNYGSGVHKASTPKRFRGFGDSGCGTGMMTNPDDPTTCISVGNSGCPSGMVTDPNDVTSCIPAPAASGSTSSGGGSSLATGIGSALTSIFGAKPTVVPQVSTASSIILPVVLGLGVVGGIVYFIKRKK